MINLSNEKILIFPTERHVKCLLTSHVWSNIPDPYLFLSKRSISYKAVARHDGQRSYQNIPFRGFVKAKRELIHNGYDKKKVDSF